MTHLIVLGLVACTLAHDALGLDRFASRVPASSTFTLTVAPMILVALFTQAWCARCGRRMDRTGSAVYVASAEGAVAISRWGTLLFHAVGVLALGWLDVVRRTIGDLVLVDEAVALLPALLTLTAGWASYYGIDDRLRQAKFFGAVERGETVYPPRTLGQYVGDQLRHQVLFMLAPMALILAWAETLNILAERWGGLLPWADSDGAFALTVSALQLTGALVVFTLSPPLVRRVWSTVRLGPGALRDRLDELCRAQRVRHRGLLVWRTHGTMLNGAVMGLFGPVRYILLTDALLDQLNDRQVEAVLAHELGHVRRRHLPWLVGAMIASLGLGGALAGLLAERWSVVFAGGPLAASPMFAGSVALAGSILAALLALGAVSRRFERQADAFAAQHLSGLTARTPHDVAAGLRITDEASDAVSGALLTVAAKNFIEPRKWTWRHGSILGRVRALRGLAGAPAAAVPIDREVRWVKRLIGLALLALLVLIAMDVWREVSGAPIVGG